jgi:hypothetical protein
MDKLAYGQTQCHKQDRVKGRHTVMRIRLLLKSCVQELRKPPSIYVYKDLAIRDSIDREVEFFKVNLKNQSYGQVFQTSLSPPLPQF